MIKVLCGLTKIEEKHVLDRTHGPSSGDNPCQPRVTGDESAFLVAHSPFSRTGMCFLRIQDFRFWEDADVLLVLCPTKNL